MGHVAARPPKQRAEARQDLFHSEWLCDVVVGAGVDPLHLLVPAASGGQHEYRHRQPGIPPSPQEREAVYSRQPEVEHHHVVAFSLRQEIRALAVGCAVHGVTGVAERGRELPRQRGFILDDEHAHGS